MDVFFEKYLEIEDEYSRLQDFRKYLIENNILKEDFNNLKLFYLNLLNLYKLGNFTEVIRFGRLMENNVLIVSKKIKDEYVKILKLIGDSYLNIGSFFNAKEKYFKALELEPDDIVILKQT